jgi:acyl carrier protein
VGVKLPGYLPPEAAGCVCFSPVILTFDAALELVIASIRELAAAGVLHPSLSTRPLSAEVGVDDLGAGSLARVAVFNALEDKAGIRLSAETLSGLKTLGQLADAVRAARAGQSRVP